MVVQCEYCMVTVHSEEAMKNHVKGKKHQRTMELLEKREKTAGISIFTKGFKQDTTEKDLWTYFSTFGKVESVYIQLNRGQYALVEFAEEDFAQAAVAQATHELNGQPLVVQPRKVRKTPRWVDKEKKLKSRQRARMRNEQRDKLALAVGHQEVCEKLKSATSIEEQINSLTEFLRMTDEEISQKQKICDILIAALVKFFPACSIHQFGSSVNGFGVKGCDVDLFLDFHEDEQEENMDDTASSSQQNAVKLPYHGDILTLAKNEGPLSADDICAMSRADKVKLISRILLEHAAGCSHVLSIPSARCPLIKFTHNPTGIKCDLTINNRIALRNTRLLQLCSRLDERVGLLVYCVRYWARIKEIAGNVNSGPRLNNYALTLMVIHYLQNLDVPLLPRVSKLVDLAGEKRLIDGWDCSHVDDPEAFLASRNTQTVDQLLEGFFKYYAVIDFSTVVLDTRMGQILPIQMILEDIHSGTKLSNFRIGPVSIQDPFVLDHNIAGNVSERLKQQISEEFQIAARKCDGWANIAEDSEFGIQLLFSKDLPQELVPKFLQLRQMDEEREDGFSIIIVLKVITLPLEAFRKLKTPDFRLNWCFKVCDFVQRVLETILMFQTEVLTQTISGEMPTAKSEKGEKMETEPTPPSPKGKRKGVKGEGARPKTRSSDAGQSTDTNTQQTNKQDYLCGSCPSLHMELMCSTCCRTWTGRKTLRKEVMADDEMDGLELETEISEKIMETMASASKYLVQFRCDIDTIVETSKTAVMMKLEPVGDSKEFANFFLFFRNFIKKLVEKHLYEQL